MGYLPPNWYVLEPKTLDVLGALEFSSISDLVGALGCHAPKPEFEARQTPCTRETGPTNAQGSELTEFLVSNSNNSNLKLK
ncbi:hypothetical protein SLEP1_g41091 [Rubroshorea leprosula]|uniref:Uncharacterized protein n=1 Tax=Rubroshorea leprosula TaxID=152421 RepID=A0AAV5L5G9_9ROSI|nr:hypothetical protein SLEP1_g41091 [Rubroshorea leprosula]